MSGIVLDVTVNDDGTVNLKSLANALGKVGDESDKAGKKGKKSLDSIGDSAKNMSNAVTRYAMDIRAQLGMALGSAGAGMLVKQGLAYNATLEATKAQFEVITGSASEAASIMKDLVDFAAKTPFELVEVANSAKILRAFGLEGNEALRIVGDAAAAAQRPIEEVAMTFGRIKSGAFGEAFMRLAEMGIATREMLEAKGLKFDAGGSYKGSAEAAITAVQAIVNERFGGMMDKLSGMWTGLMSTLRDAWSGLLGKITGPLFDTLKPKIKELSDWLNKMADSGQVEAWGKKIADTAGTAVREVKESVSWIIDHRAGIVETLKAVRDVGLAIGAIVILTKAWAAGQAVVNAITAMNPAARILSIALLIGGAIYELVQRTIGWKKVWDTLVDVVTGVAKTIGNVALATARVLAGNYEGAVDAVRGIGDAWRSVGDEAVAQSARARNSWTLTQQGAVSTVPLIFRQPEGTATPQQPLQPIDQGVIRSYEEASAALKDYSAAVLAAGESAYASRYDVYGRPDMNGPYDSPEDVKYITELMQDLIPIEQDLMAGMPRPTQEDISAWNRMKDAGVRAMTMIGDAAYMVADAIGQSISRAVFDSKAKLLDLANIMQSILGMVLSYGVRFGIASIGGPGSFLAGAMGFAGGGVVPGYGTRDSVPAYLTPGERVLSVHENRAFESMGGIAGLRAALAGPGGGTLNLSINVGGGSGDADELEEMLVPMLERWADRRHLSFARSR